MLLLLMILFVGFVSSEDAIEHVLGCGAKEHEERRNGRKDWKEPLKNISTGIGINVGVGIA